jgi:cell wall-associated NlpC family hydrolase
MKTLVLLVLLVIPTTSAAETTQLDSTITKFVTEWIGRPYKLGGSTEKGIDCSQFTKKFYNDVFKLVLPNVAYLQWNYTVRVAKDAMQIGDILFFRSKASPSGWHCGIYLGDNKFVHASSRNEGVIISDFIGTRYQYNFRGAGRPKEKM